MNNLGTLMRYEWKKLWSKKLVRAALLLILLAIIAGNLAFLMNGASLQATDADGNTVVLEVQTGYELMASERESAKALDGLYIDDALLGDMQEFELQKWTKLSRPYDALRPLVGDTVGYHMLMNAQVKIDTKLLYDAWKAKFAEKYNSSRLRGDEIDYWEKKIDTLPVPFQFRYCFCWERILGMSHSINIFVLAAIAICLSSLFSDEHRRKTDQLILCTRNGRHHVYLAKMLVGIISGVSYTLLLYAVTFIISVFFYGIQGFSAQIQLNFYQVPFKLSVGQGVLIMMGITILAVILECVFAMVLSEKLGNGLSVMAVFVGILLATELLSTHENFRFLSQICTLVPTVLINPWRFADLRTIRLVGLHLTTLQFAVILYPVLSALLFYVGYLNYRKFEVKGR